MKISEKNMCLMILIFFMLICGAISFNGNLEGLHDNEKNNKNDKDNKEKLKRPVQITPGFEDMYILKSQIVPPVCPKIPIKEESDQCPPCPPCARCPEPSFTCKKVPNYGSTYGDALPRPVLNDFSQFGM